jgi:hypothetical protein
MIHNIVYLKLNDISVDEKFNINSFSGFSTIKESVSSVGILYPLLGWKYNQSNLLIDGFKRLHLAKNSGQTELPFILLPSNYSMFDVIKIRYHNIKNEDVELNALQKISIYLLVKEINTSKDVLINWQKTLNLSSPEKFVQLLIWPEIAKNYIKKYNVSQKQIRLLLDYDHETLAEIFFIAESLSIRIVELCKIIEMVSEIALNENTSVKSILDRMEVKSILQDENLNRNHKISKLKKILYEWRFPIISNYQKKISNQLKALSFNDSIQINYDQSFERSEIILSTKLKNFDDLKKFSHSISDKSNMETLKNILGTL